MLCSFIQIVIIQSKSKARVKKLIIIPEDSHCEGVHLEIGLNKAFLYSEDLDLKVSLFSLYII